VFLPNRRRETVTNLAFTAYTLTEKLLTAFLGVVYEAIMYKYTDIRRCMTYATGCEKEMHGRIKENKKDQLNQSTKQRKEEIKGNR
jgi:hypothetical protein